MRFALLIALLLGGTAQATGFGGDAPPTRIPVPAAVFQATVEDQRGVVTDVDRVSLDGQVMLFGKLGAATVSIPFEKLDQVVFQPSDTPGKLQALAKMRDGSSLVIEVDKDVPCFGKTPFGYYKIDAVDIRKVTLKPTTPSETTPE